MDSPHDEKMQKERNMSYHINLFIILTFVTLSTTGITRNIIMKMWKNVPSRSYLNYECCNVNPCFLKLCQKYYFDTSR